MLAFTDGLARKSAESHEASAIDNASQRNYRHADFQSGVHRLLALYFNKLPGRPLLNLQYGAGLCTASSRKTHARVLDKNTYTY